MDKFFLCILLIGFCTYVDSTVNITELNVPQSIKLGSADEVILDCDFQADPTDNDDLVLKWFYNGDSMIYQWIPSFKSEGSPSEIWKPRLNLTYNYTNNHDSSPMFMALTIHNISRDISGNYTCQVSSFKEEISKTKQLIVYSPAKSELDIMLFPMESLVICTVHGISPQPEMDFYMKTENDSRTDVSEEVEMISDEDGYFNVTAKHYFDNSTLLPLTTFVCNLSIPGTDYILTKTWELHNEKSNITDIEEGYNSLTSQDADDDGDDGDDDTSMEIVKNSTEVHDSFRNQDYSGAVQIRSLYLSFTFILAWIFLNY